jgi:hypothetical protein
MADVFISYAHQDKSFADGRGIEKILKSVAPQITFWRDSGITAGSTWNEEIRDQLRACKCVFVIWSETSWASHWVRQEAFYGYVRDILVPMRIDDVALAPPFTHIQCIDIGRSIREPVLKAIGKKLGLELR